MHDLQASRVSDFMPAQSETKIWETQGHSGVHSEVANCTILDSQAEEMCIICAL